MIRWLLLTLTALCLLGCPAPSSGSGAGGPEALNLYIWSEYLDPALVEAFTKETGTPVKVSLFESTEEMLAKLQHAAGTSQYDLVVVANQSVPAMVRLELIQPLDPAKLPHRAGLDPSFRNPPYDPEERYSVPYQWGTVGLLYDAQKHPQLEPSWAVLFDPARQVGPFLLIDEARDQLGVALKYLGHSVNSTDPEQLKAAGELLLAAKRSEACLGFEGGVGGKNRVAGGLADLAVVWNGDANRAIEEAPEGKLAFVVPREGSIGWCDVLVLTREAPNPAAAHAFVDFLLRPENAARLAAYTKYATPVGAAREHLPEADRANPVIYPPDAVRATLESLTDVGDSLPLYDEVWTAVKAR
ncbi:MAG: spermidine/putrescine ABC transporter substrate-binding protein [Planctomycetes bacterium]|nr:spermidine/putrescine ABC transporter substrate-binding protein [Planctomycetota bacterium]